MPNENVPERWTREDDRAFRVLYPDYNALRRRFPSRTYYALRNHAAELGIVERRHVWTQLEVARLKRMYAGPRPSDEALMAAFPGMTSKQIKAQGTFLGIRLARTA